MSTEKKSRFNLIFSVGFGLIASLLFIVLFNLKNSEESRSEEQSFGETLMLEAFNCGLAIGEAPEQVQLLSDDTGKSGFLMRLSTSEPDFTEEQLCLLSKYGFDWALEHNEFENATTDGVEYDTGSSIQSWGIFGGRFSLGYQETGSEEWVEE